MVRALLLSHLTNNLRRLGAEEFLKKYPHPWLVWEPGAWNPPSALDDSTRQSISSPPPKRSKADDDALSFELAGSEAAAIRVGRARLNDIVINDATMSREHLILVLAGDGSWRARSPSNRLTLVAGKPVADGEQVALQEGLTLMAGDVALTFRSTAGMLALLQRLAK